MATARPRWFRVQVGLDGKVTSCREVETEGAGGASVYYKLALDAEAAARSALSAHAAKLLAARRAENRAKGRCRCGGELGDGGFVTCERCRDLSKEYQARETLKAKGIEPPHRDRRDVLQKKKQEDRLSAVIAAAPTLRLSVLLEVSRAWQDSTTNGSFTRWLNAQIADARGKRVA